MISSAFPPRVPRPGQNDEADSSKPNREYKSSVFAKLFGEDIDSLLSLFNAICGTTFSSATSAVDIVTLENVLFHGLLNDIAFTIDGMLVIMIEHQSTINPNMPLRFLLYVVGVFKEIIATDSLYHRRLVHIPMPVFIVLYNGPDVDWDFKSLNLADAFKRVPGMETYAGLNLEVKVYNVNYGHNTEIMAKCRDLHDYAFFVRRVRERTAPGMSLGDAIRAAVEDCLNGGVLRDFLSRHSSEVINMLTLEWDQDTALKVSYEDGLIDGEERGIKIGIEQGEERGLERGAITIALRMIDKNRPVREIAEFTLLPEDKILSLRNTRSA